MFYSFKCLVNNTYEEKECKHEGSIFNRKIVFCSDNFVVKNKSTEFYNKIFQLAIVENTGSLIISIILNSLHYFWYIRAATRPPKLMPFKSAQPIITEILIFIFCMKVIIMNWTNSSLLNLIVLLTKFLSTVWKLIQLWLWLILLTFFFQCYFAYF